ncbi:MAG: hypothetical protein ACI9TI_000839 [Natronomonas sp.]|jgi:hypothetical protein
MRLPDAPEAFDAVGVRHIVIGDDTVERRFREIRFRLGCTRCGFHLETVVPTLEKGRDHLGERGFVDVQHPYRPLHAASVPTIPI